MSTRRICPKGHDTRLHGRTLNGRCVRCRKQRKAKKTRNGKRNPKKTIELEGPPQWAINRILNLINSIDLSHGRQRAALQGEVIRLRSLPAGARPPLV